VKYKSYLWLVISSQKDLQAIVSDYSHNPNSFASYLCFFKYQPKSIFSKYSYYYIIILYRVNELLFFALLLKAAQRYTHILIIQEGFLKNTKFFSLEYYHRF